MQSSRFMAAALGIACQLHRQVVRLPSWLLRIEGRPHPGVPIFDKGQTHHAIHNVGPVAFSRQFDNAYGICQLLGHRTRSCLSVPELSGGSHDVERNSNTLDESGAAEGGGDDLVMMAARTEKIAEFAMLTAEALGRVVGS
jgi:hypothetical protein